MWRAALLCTLIAAIAAALADVSDDHPPRQVLRTRLHDHDNNDDDALLSLLHNRQMSIARTAKWKGVHQDTLIKSKSAATPVLPHGKVLQTDMVIQPVYWGTKWASTQFAQRKAVLIRDLYTGILASDYFKVMDQYLFGQTPSIKVLPDMYQSSAAPTKKQDASYAFYRKFICDTIIPELGSLPSGKTINNMYFVLNVDTGPYGDSCAYHTYNWCGTDKTKWFTYAVIFPYSSGCGTRLAVAGKTVEECSFVDSSTHELLETMSDPTFDGWYRGSDEIIDRCEYNPDHLVTVNGQSFALEGIFSNAARKCLFSL